MRRTMYSETLWGCALFSSVEFWLYFCAQQRICNIYTLSIKQQLQNL